MMLLLVYQQHSKNVNNNTAPGEAHKYADGTENKPAKVTANASIAVVAPCTDTFGLFNIIAANGPQKTKTKATID